MSIEQQLAEQARRRAALAVAITSHQKSIARRLVIFSERLIGLAEETTRLAEEIAKMQAALDEILKEEKQDG